MIERWLVSLGWVGAVASLVGAYFVAERNVAGFYLFLIADLMLLGIQVYRRTWPQVFLLGAYAVMNVKGILYHA